MARVTSALLSLLLTFTTAKEFGIEDIVPYHRVVAQIGHKLALSCRTTDCESPYFSWRTELDHPLGGNLSTQGKTSVLTIQSVGFQHEHQYVCTAGCKLDVPSKEKAVMVEVYSFPSDPVIELKSPLILGQPASVTCRVPKVYPSEQLMITLIKGKLLSEKEFFQDPHTKSLETKNLKMDFIPTEEDFGKEIICRAELLLEDMALKPRQSTHVMEINYGPRNTQIVAFPGNTILEGEALILTCSTESHPQASFVWKKQLPDGLTQNIMGKYNVSIPNPQASDSGTYICEVTNEVTSVVERRSLYISVQASAFSTATSTLTTQSETTVFTTPSETTVLNTPSETTTSFTSDAASETTKSVTTRATLKTFVSATSEIATRELITMSASDTAPKIITSVTSHAALKNNTVVYLVGVSDDDRNNTEEIIIIAEEFGIEDIVPDHRVVAQIGHKLALNCRTTDCESPYFSWRTQLDHPLAGKLSTQGKTSVLTIQSVGFQHEHQYVCTAGCKLDEPSKEKAVMVDVYSFPSDPVIELKSPLILGQPASVTCRVPKVYPSEQLMITLIKGKLSSEKEFFQDPHTKSLETKNLKMDFIPTEEDFGKEIICRAELLLEDMALKPRQSTHVMEINYGPRNTQIVAFPGNTILEGEALILTCSTESHPQASFVWKKQLPDGLTQNIMGKYNLSIPNPQASDSGTYICEVTNEVTSVVERRSLHISVQASAFSTAASTLTTQSETTAFTTPSETTVFSTTVAVATAEASTTVPTVSPPT